MHLHPDKSKPRGNRAGWAVADQALIAATNFATMVLLARSVSPHEFGVFTLLYSVLLFGNSLQGGLVTQPHNVLGASLRDEAYRRYTTTTALMQLGLAGTVSALVLIGWMVAVALRWEFAATLLPLAAAVFAWQAQEFVRRVLYTEGRLASALANDVISYGGQTAWMAALWWRGGLTSGPALWAIAITSTVAVIVGAIQLRGSISRETDAKAWRENWDFGKWLAGGEIVGYWLSTQVFIYLTGACLGAAAVGVLRAIHTLFGPTRVLAYVFSTVLPTRLARTLADDGEDAMHRQLVQAFRFAVPVLGGYCVLAALLAGPLMRVLYGSKYAGHDAVFAIYALYTFVSYLGMVTAAALRARRLTRHVFFSRLTASLLSIPVGWTLILLGRSFGYGLHAAALAMVVTSTLLACLFWRAYCQGGAKRRVPESQEMKLVPAVG